MLPSPSLKRRLSLSIQSKVLALSLAPLFVVTTAIVTMEAFDRIELTESVLQDQRAALIESRRVAVKDTVEAALSTVQPLISNAGASERRAQEQVKTLLRNAVFDDGNYIFVYDHDGTNLVTRPSPHQEGTNMASVTDTNGQYLIRDLIEVAKAGGGYYEYHWAHPTTGNNEIKYSYATSIDQWDWMIGAGVYATGIDAAMAEAEAHAATSLRSAILKTVGLGLISFLVVAGLAVLLVRRTVRPIRSTAAAMKDIAEGRGDLTRRLNAATSDEIGELATQFVTIQLAVGRGSPTT